VLSGCAISCPDGSSISRGVDEATVQTRFGLPDAISDTSGDQRRFYSPFNRPEDEWPRTAAKEFYYLRSTSAFRFQGGKLVAVYSIQNSDLRSLVERIVERTEDERCPTQGAVR
jgi:hypothetical protein